LDWSEWKAIKYQEDFGEHAEAMETTTVAPTPAARGRNETLDGTRGLNRLPHSDFSGNGKGMSGESDDSSVPAMKVELASVNESSTGSMGSHLER
jgi:hypothetical protein